MVGDLDGSVVLPGQNYNIAFMVDSSGSIGDEAMKVIRTQLEKVFTSLKTSAGTDNAGTVNIFLVDFDTTTHGSVSVNLTDSGALKTLLDALKGMSADGGTNYEAAFSKAADWFAASTARSNVDAKNLAYFITDGKPNDLDIYDSRYGIEDTRMAVHEARRMGLTPFCVTIDREAGSYLPYLFGPAGFCVIRKPEELPRRLPLLYVQLTRQ